MYLTPGIYLSQPTAARPGIGIVRTDIAGFVGFAERGPLPGVESSELLDPMTLAIRLTSWSEFRAKFGGFIPYGYLGYAVRAFFENGGTTCYVVRVAASSNPDPLKRPCAAAFTMPAGALVTPVTSLSAALAKGQTSLAVVSTAGITVGNFISVHGTGATEYVTVQAIPDDKTLMLQRPVQANHLAGAPISLVTGGRLSADVAAGQTEIALDNTAGFAAGDLVAVTGPGVAEVTTIAAVLDGRRMLLARKLQANHAAGDIVLKYSGAFIVSATSPGNWGNRVRLEVTPLETGETVTEFALRVTADAGPDLTQPTEVEFYHHLSLNPELVRFYAPKVVNETSQLIRISLDPPARLLVGSGPLTGGAVYLMGGQDGLRDVQLHDFTGDLANLRGLRILEQIEEIGILCVPDALFEPPPVLSRRPPPPQDPCEKPAPPPPPDPSADDPTAIPPPMTGQTAAIYQAMIDQCERLRYRVAVLAPPDFLQPNQVLQWPGEQRLITRSAKFAAFYYPWLKVPDALSADNTSRRIPPVGHVAGVYARTDNAVGVQQPPANAALEFAVDVTESISNLQQEPLNAGRINVIRSFAGRGLRIWGARSLSPEPQWLFIHVRRVMSMIEESVEKATQWTVFEPNTDTLRRSLVHSLTVFLEGIWRKGGLQGTKPAAALYVKCDETNNPQTVIDAGLLVCEIGIAVAAPMEFLVFEIRRTGSGSEVLEA